MKHIATAAALGVVALLASCVSRQVAVEAESRSDSLELVVSAKDSLINAVFADINAISENLALIKSRENLITVAGESEGGRRPVEEIDNDIKAIDRLLRENRAKIESLQRSAAQLRKANLRIDGLEKMIADMNKLLAEKKAEVEQLRESLVRMGDEVKSLTEEVAVRSAEVENLSGEKVELQNQLNTVYYIVGAEKELRDAQIINKQGFIGRTLTVGRNSNFDSFTMADSRLLSEVPVGQKKATLVTSHPEGSYELVTDANKVVEKLIITDPVRFWESSKILIISCK
uniref:Cbp1 family collagen-binding glycoprotein adhesin n=1 Tax=Alistipes shahii TaxID=328814 RepID=UPI003FED98DC